MRIALNIIMKNEAHILPRFLNAVLPIIDTYCIVDTGSTDDSKKIVKDFFDSKNIKGEVIDYPNPSKDGLLDFCGWRNFALEKAKEIADYGFLIGCDEILTIKNNFDLQKFKQELSKHDFASINIKHNDLIYSRQSFFKLSNDISWKHKVHEHLYCNNPLFKTTQFFSHDLEVIYTNDGNSWKEGVKNKYLRYANTLIKEVEAHNDPRDVFYVAQSFKDAGEREKAIEWYQKRLEFKNGFFEELYYSQLMIAGLKWELGYQVMEVADEYMKCGELDPLKAEHLYFLKIMYERNGRPSSALKIGELLKQYTNPYPTRVLFLNPLAYKN